MSANDGVGHQRRLKIDFHGRDTWVGSWQALSQPCRIHGLVDQTVIAAMFLILVENLLAIQDSRSRIIQTGLWVVNQRSIFLVVKMRLASFQLTNVEFLAMILASILITP